MKEKSYERDMCLRGLYMVDRDVRKSTRHLVEHESTRHLVEQ